MSEEKGPYMSLCYYESDDNDGNKLLWRLADVRDDSKLSVPQKTNPNGTNFENRDRLFGKDGPDKIRTIGIWEWIARPNRNDSNKDFIESKYNRELSPIRIVDFNVKSIEEVVYILKQRNIIFPCYCDTLFCYKSKPKELTGVLLRANEFEIVDNHIQPHSDVYVLPCHTILLEECHSCKCKKEALSFLKKFSIDKPSKYIAIVDINKLVRDLVLNRATRKTFLENIGGTRADWQNCRKLLEKICEDSLYDEVAQKLKCTEDKAKQAVVGFIQRANEFIESGDIDEEILAQIAMRHDEFRAQREKIIETKWEEANASMIANVKAAEDKVQKLQEECAEKEKERDNLIAEIDKYEALGKDTLEAIRQKITDAQEDMAGYIAKLSLFLPHTRPVFSPGQQKSAWRYVYSSDELCADCDIEETRTWQDEVNVIHQNLANSLNIAPEFVTMLSAFLYSSYINNVPMLIVGPCGPDIADLLSVSLFGSGAGRLIFGDERDDEIVEKIQGYKERILSIQNMFGKGWSDELPQAFCKLRKTVIWTHPYVEDMLVEPKGLYNYMLPVLSESFIGAMPPSDLTLISGKRPADFEAYKPKGACRHIKTLRRLGLSKLLTKQLELVLSDAKTMLNIVDQDKDRDKDIEFLFATIPFCVLTGRIDVLKDAVEENVNEISRPVKDEAERFIEETD